MQLDTLTHTHARGWSAPRFPELDSENTLVLVFGASAAAAEGAALRELRAAFPRAQHVGCSTSGEICGPALADDSLTVAIARFDATRLSSASVHIDRSEDSYSAGRELAERLRAPGLRAILVLSDGLLVNGSELVRGINSAVQPTVVVTGGLAGDGQRFEHTWVLGQAAAAPHVATAVAFYGERLRIGHGSRGGFDPFGPERLVTRAAGNELFELDGKPALQLYKEYLGERAKDLPASALFFPLALRADRTETKLLVRSILSVDEEAQSMRFAGNIEPGALAQLMHANLERLIEGAAAATQQALDLMRMPQGPALAIAISCVGRRVVLGERAEEELEAVAALLPRGSRTVGFYSYGEIAPYREGHSDLHNQTLTLTTLAEG